MRILHPSPVGYIQSYNNSNNTNRSTSILGGNTITANNISTTANRTTTSDYSTDLTNLNGNPTDTALIQEKLAYGLINADDNVNLTISSNRNTNLNQNHSVKYTRNRNYCANTNTNTNTNSNPNINSSIEKIHSGTDAEVFCNNLNQLNNFKRKTTTNINGNDNDCRQIFEGNLNVLEIEEEDIKISVEKAPLSELDTLKRRKESKVETSLTLDSEYQAKEYNQPGKEYEEEEEEEEDEDDNDEEEEEDEEEDGPQRITEETFESRNLICNDNHLSNTATQNGYNTSSLGKPAQRTVVPGRTTNSVVLSRQNLAKLDLDSNLPTLNHRNHRLPQFGVVGCNNQTNTSKNNPCGGLVIGGQGSKTQVVSYSPTCSGDTSPDDSLMEEEDAYSPTPSSCASLSSPEPGNFPRGIINPNYPGFQHLAHTLSEHFVDHHNEQDDSDLSEFEVELSVESLDENFANSFLLNNNNNHPVNNNNNNEDSISSSPKSDISLKEVSLNDEVNFNLENSELKQAREHKNICLPEIRVSSSLGNEEINTESNLNQCIESDENNAETNVMSSDDTQKQQNIEIIPVNSENLESSCNITKEEETYEPEEDISCDLNTYLKKYETATDAKTIKVVNNNKELTEESNEFQENESRNCPTPDILIKNEKGHSHRKTSSENRPDLLRNVSPKPEAHPFDDGDKTTDIIIRDSVEDRKCRISVPDNISIESKRTPTDKDETSFGITPVDIVGDFGREIEREFGLIVSGYNTTLICRDVVKEIADKQTEARFEKTTDAALSNGKEHISVSTSVNNANTSFVVQSDCGTTCDLVKTSPSGGIEKKQIHHKEQTVVEQQTNILQKPTQKQEENDSNIVDGTSKLITKNSIPSSSSSSSSSSSYNQTNTNNEKLIPTAIVKPKYQKSSYDERQLPPIGIGYFDKNRAWFDNKNSHNHHHHSAHHHSIGQSNTATSISTTSTIVAGNDQRSRKIQQQFTAHLDRSSKKKIIGRVGLISSSSSSSPNSSSGSTSRDKFVNSRRYDKDNESSVVAIVTPRKKDKMETNMINEKKALGGYLEKNNNNNSNINNSNYTSGSNNNNNSTNNSNKCVDINRYESFGARDKKKDLHHRHNHQSSAASFDVYNIETALPVIDLEAIENHLKKAKEEERKRRNDREEIRRRLAMGAEDDYFSKIVTADRPGRKPSLQSRLQSGMNLQICFMNEASSDTESPSSDSETCPKLSKSSSNSSNMSRYSSSSVSSTSAHPYHSRPLSVSITSNNNKKHQLSNRPSTLSLGPPVTEDTPESDFFTKQARLQIEARMALAQAKDMAHMQMEIERQKQKQSPITEVIRNSLDKVGVIFPPEKRRVSRQMLTDMNIAQLQIIVNELHSQIERLNEQLVQYLMERDDLHMSQDSMLVDIEDLTRYLGAKEQSKSNEKSGNKLNLSTTTINSNNSTTTALKCSTKFRESQNLATLNNQSSSLLNIQPSHQQQETGPTGGLTTSSSSSSVGGTQSKFLRIASLVKK